MGNACGKKERRDAPAAYAIGHGQTYQPVVQRIPSAHNGSGVQAICSAGDGILLSGGIDKEVVLLDWANGSELSRWRGHTSMIMRVAHAPSAELFFSASRDQLVHAWRRNSPAPAVTLRGHALTVSGLALSEAHGRVVTGARDYSVRLWDLPTGAALESNTISRNVVTWVQWIEGEAAFVQCGEDLQVRVWDARIMQPVQVLAGHVNIPTCCDAAGAGRPHAIVTCSNGFDGSGCEARLWDRRTGGGARVYQGHTQSVSACAFLRGSARGSAESGAGQAPLLFATAGADKAVRLWSADEGSAEGSAGPSAEGPPALAVEPFNTGDGEPITCLASLESSESGIAGAGGGRMNGIRDVVGAGNYGGALRVYGVVADGHGAELRALRQTADRAAAEQ